MVSHGWESAGTLVAETAHRNETDEKRTAGHRVKTPLLDHELILASPAVVRIYFEDTLTCLLSRTHAHTRITSWARVFEALVSPDLPCTLAVVVVSSKFWCPSSVSRSMRTTTAHGLTARRREIRSSSHFQVGLASCLLFVVLLSSCSSHFLSSNRQTPQPQQFLNPHRRPPASPSLPDDSPASQMGKSSNRQLRLDGQQEQQITSPETSVTMDIETHHATIPLRLVSFNIRFATNKSERVLGEQPWEVRCPKVCAQLRFISAGHESPFLCLQESLYSQLNDIQAQLGKPWAHIGRGRGKGETDEEFSPIFYRSDTWACEHSETRWLSSTPERPSRGWDAALNRIVTIGLFSHRATDAKVVVMSTHFDHVGVEARKNSAKLLIEFADEWSRARGRAQPPPSAVLVGGDFNSQPDDEAYKMMTAPGSGMSDVSDLVHESKHYGNHLTYTSFGEPSEHPQRIDFLFVQEPTTAKVETFGVLANSFDDQIRFSDHRPVVSDLHIRIQT